MERRHRRSSPRMPIGCPVTLAAKPEAGERIPGQAINLSMAGMFVVAESLPSPGSVLRFGLQPSSRWRPIEGSARVVWVRHRDVAPELPRGMGLRILDLDESGRQAIRWLLETHESSGGRPIEEWTIPARFTREGAPELATVEARPTAPPRIRMLQWTAIVLVLGALAGGVYWLRDRGSEARRSNSGAARPHEPATSTDAPPAADHVATRGSRRESTAATNDDETIAQMVRAWADAWTARDVDAYFAFYSADFRPPAGTTREQWEQLRRRLISQARFIAVEVEELRVAAVGSDRATATFIQRYSSDRFNDVVTKRLDLVRTADGWRITGERPRN